MPATSFPGGTQANSYIDTGYSLGGSYSLEETLRFKHERMRFAGSLWHTSFSNYIFGELTGRTCDDDGNCVADDSQELKEPNYTHVDATFRGAEGKVVTCAWSCEQRSKKRSRSAGQ
jgi:iron complex outermembrane receptor protein